MEDLVCFKHLKLKFLSEGWDFFYFFSKRSICAVHHEASTTLLVTQCAKLCVLSLLLSSFCRQGCFLLVGDVSGFLGDCVNFAGSKNIGKSF